MLWSCWHQHATSTAALTVSCGGDTQAMSRLISSQSSPVSNGVVAASTGRRECRPGAADKGGLTVAPDATLGSYGQVMTIEKRDRTGRRVGELAQASGLTVRTLHYYEQIGLLVPSSPELAHVSAQASLPRAET
jgi:hypothetical protein